MSPADCVCQSGVFNYREWNLLFNHFEAAHCRSPLNPAVRAANLRAASRFAHIQ